MSKNQKIMVGVGAGILLALILCVCVLGIIGFIYREPLLALLGFGPSQKVARMLPEGTQFYASINPNLQNVAGYQNLKKLYLDNPDIQALSDEFKADMKEETGITFEDDIKPWLGTEVVMAVPDLAGTIKDSSSVPPFVIAAQTTNQEASDNFISKILAKAAEDGEAFTEEVYQNVTLHIREDQFSDETVVITTFDDFVFLTSRDTLIKDMIDKARGKSDQPSLADSARFKRITGELPSEAVVTMYVASASIFDAFLEESAFELPEESTKDLEAFEAVAMAGILQPDGIQLDIVVTYDVEKMSERMKASLQQPASPNTILNNIPAEALFVYNANNLSNVWQQTKQGLESNPDFGETMKDMEEELGFSLEEDIFSWMTGEFAVVLLEVTPPDEYSPPLGGYALIGTDDVDKARSHIDKVMGTFEEQGMMPPLDTQTIGGVEMNVFIDDYNQEVMGGYGFYNNYFLLVYPGDAIQAATSASQNPLPNSDNFKAMQNRLPAKNYGYFYADLDRAQQIIEKEMSDYDREEYEKNVRPFLEPAHALGVAANTEGVEQGISKGVFFILISE
jgi:hypothetical protein